MPTMGRYAQRAFFEISFEDCHVSSDGLLGKEGLGFSYAMESLNDGRLNVGATRGGKWATSPSNWRKSTPKTRIAFGKPIAEKSGLYDISSPMRRSSCTLQSSCSTTLLGEADAGEDIAIDFPPWSRYSVPKRPGRVVDTAVQLFGAAGYSRGRDRRTALSRRQGTTDIRRRLGGASQFRGSRNYVELADAK